MLLQSFDFRNLYDNYRNKNYHKQIKGSHMQLLHDGWIPNFYRQESRSN